MNSPNPDSSLASKHQIDVSQLPSVRDGSLTPQEEAMKRRKTCRFIEEVGRTLKLPRVAVATAMVFFHRFYAKHSFKDQYVEAGCRNELVVPKLVVKKFPSFFSNE
jgi:hypothetical protein